MRVDVRYTSLVDAVRQEFLDLADYAEGLAIALGEHAHSYATRDLRSLHGVVKRLIKRMDSVSGDYFVFIRLKQPQAAPQDGSESAPAEACERSGAAPGSSTEARSSLSGSLSPESDRSPAR